MVVDALERPQLAEDEKILATPTIMKGLPAIQEKSLATSNWDTVCSSWISMQRRFNIPLPDALKG